MANKYAMSIFPHFSASGGGVVSRLFNNVQLVFAHKKSSPIPRDGVYFFYFCPQKSLPVSRKAAKSLAFPDRHNRPDFGMTNGVFTFVIRHSGLVILNMKMFLDVLRYNFPIKQVDDTVSIVRIIR